MVFKIHFSIKANTTSNQDSPPGEVIRDRIPYFIAN